MTFKGKDDKIQAFFFFITAKSTTFLFVYMGLYVEVGVNCDQF